MDCDQITYKFTPFRLDEQPVTLTIPGNLTEQWVPVFDTPDALREGMAIADITDYKIKQILDGRLFLIDVIGAMGLRVMYNPRVVDGRSRWTELKLE